MSGRMRCPSCNGTLSVSCGTCDGEGIAYVYSRAESEALMGAAKALARQHRPFIGRRSKEPCDVCDALAALRFAGITADQAPASE